MVYCVSVWASTYPTTLIQILILQKRVIRIISKKPFDAHTDPIFKDLEILKFPEIYLFHIGKFMYLYKKGLLPNIFDGMFTVTSDIHSYNTRNSKTFYVFSARTNIRSFAIRFKGPIFFNSLGSKIQNSASISLFKSRLKAFFLS